MDYWYECISEAFEDAGIVATKDQITTVSGWVEGAHDNYGMAHGHDAIPNPVIYEAEKELRKLKRENEEHKMWLLSTKPCRRCTTTGSVLDGWGRDQTCPDCDGKGRT
jgi:hypothetical protein